MPSKKGAPDVPPQSASSPTPHTELYPMSNWKYDTFLWFMSIFVDLFFREVHPRGSWKVPRQGPVLFVAAPHANQVSSSCLPLTLGEVSCYQTITQTKCCH